MQSAYGVDCRRLYGEDLSVMPGELACLLAGRLEAQSERIGAAAFQELARLLCLQVSGEMWSGHIAALRDLLAVELLSPRSHKSAVAAYIRRCVDAWEGHWESVYEEFLRRLCSMRLPSPEKPGAPEGQPPPPAAVSRETEQLLILGRDMGIATMT